jgi:hypothetical protein
MIRTYPFYSNWSEVGVSLHIGTGGLCIFRSPPNGRNFAKTGAAQLRSFILDPQFHLH